MEPKKNQEEEKKIRQKEIDRYLDFAKSAENSLECIKLLNDLGGF